MSDNRNEPLTLPEFDEAGHSAMLEDDRPRGKIERSLRAVEDAACVAAGFALMCSILIVSYGVVGRRLTNWSTSWVLETSEYLLLGITFLSAPWVFRVGGHVAVDILVSRLGGTGQSVVSRFQALLCIVVSAVLLYSASETTLEAFQRGITLGRTLDLPRWPLLSLIPFAALLIMLRALAALIHSVRKHNPAHDSNELEA